MPTRAYAAIAAGVGWAVLALQFYLTPTLHFFGYFTVLTNLLVAVAFTSRLLPTDTPIARFFADPRVATAIAVYITVVGIVYSLLLRATWDPTGAQLVADVALHDILPIVYVIFWFMFVRRGRLAWSEPIRWLVYPFVYVIYVLAQGAVTGRYVYPFLDVSAHNYAVVVRNMVGMAIGFWVIGLAFVAVDRWRS